MRDELGKEKIKSDIDKLLDDMEKNKDDIIFNKISQKTIDRQNKYYQGYWILMKLKERARRR